MKKIISILSLLLVIFSLVPMSLSAAATTQPVIWVDTDGDGHDEYTDSLGNTWITLTIDEDGNRLILSEKTLGVVEFEDEFNGGFPDTTTVYNDYATSDLKAEMDMFYNGGDSETKVNDTVYYLAPELKAIAQPVVLPDDEVVTFAENDPTTPDLDESAFIASATGGMSYVDESGQTTCFALSISETITYLANGVVTPGVKIPSMATEHAPGANFAATGEDYDGVDTYPKPGEPSVDHPTNGGTGWTTRSAADSNYDVAKINSTGLTGRDHVDNNSGFRPALWVSEADSDADGISDTEEAKLGTKPLVADSDEDGLKDGEEVTLGTKPLVGDSDEDGLKDGEEVTLGKNH